MCVGKEVCVCVLGKSHRTEVKPQRFCEASNQAHGSWYPLRTGAIEALANNDIESNRQKEAKWMANLWCGAEEVVSTTSYILCKVSINDWRTTSSDDMPCLRLHPTAKRESFVLRRSEGRLSEVYIQSTVDGELYMAIKAYRMLLEYYFQSEFD